MGLQGVLTPTACVYDGKVGIVVEKKRVGKPMGKQKMASCMLVQITGQI